MENTDLDNLRDAHRRMAEFVAHCELAENKLNTWMQAVTQTIETHQTVLDTQVQQMQQATREAEEVINYFNTAKLKLNVETTLTKTQEQIEALETLGQQYVNALQGCNEEFQKIATKSFERLDRASAYTIKNISDALNSFRLSDFQRYTEQSCESIKETSRAAIAHMRQQHRWFHWKNLGLVAAVTLFVTLSMGLYLNDELPWEIHKRVAMQRNAGEALLNAWPSLTQAEQKKIIEQSKRSI
jgi:hypothetical protein